MAEKALKWRVETDQGNFEVEFDRQVTLEEARTAAERQLGIAPEAPSRESGLTGLRQPAADVERRAARFLLPLAAVAATGPAAGALGITSRAGTLGLEALLGGLGEAGTQAVGLAEPSATQIGLAAGSPLAGRAAGAATGFLRRQAALRLPGAGQALRQAGVRTAEGLPGTIAPKTPSDALYDLVDQFNPNVPLGPLKGKAAKIVGEEAVAEQFGLGLSTTEIAKKLAKADELPFQDVRLLMRRLNERIGGAKAKGGEGLGDLMQLKRSFAESLEQAADKQVGEAFAVLKEANSAFRQEIAQDTLTDILSRAITPLEGREAVNISAGKALKQLNEAVRKDRFLEKSFPAGSLDRIRTALEEIRKLPVIGAPSGADAGSKALLKRSVVGGALGELGGQAFGLPTGTGAAIGTISGIGLSESISQLLQTEMGTRFLLRAVRESGGLITRNVSGLLGAAARSGGAATLGQ